MTLKQDFINDFSISAFKTIDGEQVIQGKYGIITQDDMYDAWFFGDLSSRKVTNLEKAVRDLNHTVEGTLTRVTGEMWVRGRGKEFVREIAPYVGVKRKRRISSKTRQENIKRLHEARNSL